MDDQTALSAFDFTADRIIAGRYRFDKVLGKGGMGMVIRVKDEALDNTVIALKLLFPHLLEDRTIFSRFKNEVIVARQLSHPNIVRLYDFGIDERGIAFLSMEYVENTSLSKIIHNREGRFMPFEEIVRILYEVSLGMQHAHSEGVIHRDIKPDNILITKQSRVKITASLTQTSS